LRRFSLPLPAQEFPAAPFEERPNAEPLNLNVELPTWGGKQFWTDVLHFHQWRIQRNVFTARWR
jgi:hypothetical protein